MQEEVENRTVNLAISTTKLTGRTIIAGIRKYLQHREKVKMKKARDPAVHGKQSVKQLLGQNQGATNVEIDKESIRDFEKLAKKYGVDFAVRKDKSVACYELIQMIIDHNNLANFETWIFFKWVFKTFVAVMLITNTFNITMAVFDVTQHVINASAGIISGNTAIDASALETMEETLMAMDLGPLLGLFLQSFIVQVTMSALAIIIFVIVYGRMIEIYLMVSLAPIPLSTFGNREQSNIGQNYLRSLFAIGFQGFLIMICVGIYAVLIQSIAFSDDIIGSIWGVMGYTVLLCFTLFKTGSLAKGVFSAH